MTMNEQQRSAFARLVQVAMARVVPDWTDHNAHDPGVTVLEVLSYALTDLELRTPLDDRTRSLVQSVADRADALARRFATNPPRLDPYKDFKFRVKWDGRYVAGVSKVSALKRTTDIVEYREGGDPTATRKVPGQTRYEPITLERGVSYDREFEAWADAVLSGGAASSVVRRDVTIELFDDAGQVLMSYVAKGCWVSQYQALPDLESGSGATLIETLRLECDAWDRVDS